MSGYSSGDDVFRDVVWPGSLPAHNGYRKGSCQVVLLIELFCGLYVECFCEGGDRILYGISGRHLYLPFTGLAVTADKVRVELFDLIEERCANSLRTFIVLFLETIGTGNTATAVAKHGKLYAGYHFEQRGRVDRPTHAGHVAGRMISQFLVEVFTEGQLQMSCLDLLVEPARGEHDGVAYVAVLDVQQMRIFVTDGERTGAACRQYGFAPIDSFFHDIDVVLSLFCRLFVQTVSDHGYTAAFLVIKQPYADAACVEDLQKIAGELREVVVSVAAVEIADMFRIGFLLLGVLLIPLLEGLERIGGEGTVLVDLHDAVHHSFHGFQA